MNGKVIWAVLALALVFIIAGTIAGGGEEAMTGHEDEVEMGENIPLLDLQIPEITETATFALG